MQKQQLLKVEHLVTKNKVKDSSVENIHLTSSLELKRKVISM